MSHHDSGPFDDKPDRPERAKLLEDLLETKSFRGALGDFPEGQLTKSDEGAIQFTISEKKGKVVLDFGTQVHWVGMNPQQAADLASLLMKHARAVARQNGETISFTL